MEKMINCFYWKEYQGLNGWVMFCGAGAFSKQFSKDYAEGLGCTTEQRSICKKTMESNIGYSVLPKIDLKDIKGIPAEKEPVPTLKNTK